jgi:hypothetical protein
VEIPAMDAFGRETTKYGATLVIYGGTCNDCSLNGLDLTKIPHDAYDQVLLLFDDLPNMLPERFRTLPPNVRVHADPERGLQSKLNAIWLGRHYQIVDGSLVHIQTSPDEPTRRVSAMHKGRAE